MSEQDVQDYADQVTKALEDTITRFMFTTPGNNMMAALCGTIQYMKRLAEDVPTSISKDIYLEAVESVAMLSQHICEAFMAIEDREGDE